MSSQKGCFTVHGACKEDFETMFSETKLVKGGYLRKYVIPSGHRIVIEKELDFLGITYSVISPTLEGLSFELKHRFRTDLSRD